jgi:hypothetical protein
MNSPAVAHRYYPIGMPSYWEEYAGIKEIRAIVHKKILAIQEGTLTPWKLLMEKLMDDYHRYPIANYDFQQFPSYSAEINLEVKVTNQVTVRKSIILKVSLLANAYTVFIVDVIDKEKRSYPHSASLNIAYCDAENSLEIKMIIHNIRTTLEKFFPGFHFISHSILMKHMIYACVTYGSFQQDNRGHSLYQLLFDGEFIPEKVKD